MIKPTFHRLATLRLLLAIVATTLTAGVAASSQAPVETGGPMRLREAAPRVAPREPAAPQDSEGARRAPSAADGVVERAQPYVPGEFERYVQRLLSPDQPRPDQMVRRLGAELVTPSSAFAGQTEAQGSPAVPPDYVLGPGDEIMVTLWGSVDADLRAVIDRSGRITIPRVGPVMLGGVRYGDAAEAIRRRVGLVFRNFDLSVSLGQLRSIRVFVTGFVTRPGLYTVSSLSTVSHALLRAGGPSSAGSFRKLQLRRGQQAPIAYDLYDLLLKGDRSADRILQADDVIHVGPVGPQVAVLGSVNQPAIVELKANETVSDALAMVGGFSAVADRRRVTLERLDERNDVRVTQISLPSGASMPLQSGDVVRAFSAVEAVLSTQRQNKRVRIEGEVLRPGEYVLPAQSTVQDAIAAAGGLAPGAYVFGTEFTRESVRTAQQENYDRALRDLETQLTLRTSTQRTSTAEDAATQAASAAAASRLVERLRALRPTGRIVLQLQPESTTLPSLLLEEGDRLYIPARPSSVGVFGSVYNAGNYLFTAGRQVEEYVALAGGPTRGADKGSAFVIRANGSVVSAGNMESRWFRQSELVNVEAQPGDTIFIPEELNKTTFIQTAKDVTQILYQLGLGVAGLKALGN